MTENTRNKVKAGRSERIGGCAGHSPVDRVLATYSIRPDSLSTEEGKNVGRHLKVLLDAMLVTIGP